MSRAGDHGRHRRPGAASTSLPRGHVEGWEYGVRSNWYGYGPHTQWYGPRELAEDWLDHGDPAARRVTARLVRRGVGTTGPAQPVPAAPGPATGPTRPPPSAGAATPRVPAPPQRRPVVVDTDVGGDPVALLTAAMCIRDLALVASADEQDGQRARFARHLLDLAGRPDVPVAPGRPAAHPGRFCVAGLIPGRGRAAGLVGLGPMGHRGSAKPPRQVRKGAVVSGDPPPLATPDASGLHTVARIVGVPPRDVADLVVLLGAAAASIRSRLGHLANHAGAAAAAALAAAARHAAADEHADQVIASVYCLLAQLWAEAGGHRDLAAGALDQMAAIEPRAGDPGTAGQLEQEAAQQRAAAE